MRNRSYENNFDLHENETACRTHFCMKGFALWLVLRHRHKSTRKWPIYLLTFSFQTLLYSLVRVRIWLQTNGKIWGDSAWKFDLNRRSDVHAFQNSWSAESVVYLLHAELMWLRMARFETISAGWSKQTNDNHFSKKFVLVCGFNNKDPGAFTQSVLTVQILFPYSSSFPLA